MAEIVGFEPTVEYKPYDDLANRCLKPLSHISSISAHLFCYEENGQNPKPQSSG